ncbi:uncharacterized protein MONBRDRAFT_4779 [Monosiga brevicollis MX1]|uniref:FAD dependent oxidoreductase domain-containing protein n=1 Tax=Monosiga brevicollis TaxID=81824 RepID=A9UNX2_MONBE|nr:uncharacterized protein MONBRDRAFT_4779 [Monosiga brevicollis MX1]EDQ92774.1 predicted protein [Monosiga brevicollis MX1]|eukprot:XP_001742536.1 hypothetical protein [Monosiga brevicollis MX1]
MAEGVGNEADVIVVGAGIIGSACARHILGLIQDPGLRVLVVAPGEPALQWSNTHAQWDKTHAGSYAAHYDEGRITRTIDAHPVWSRLARASIDRYRDLEVQSGVNFYTESGYLLVGRPQTKDSYYAQARHTVISEGVSAEVLDRAALGVRFPALQLPPHCEGLYQARGAGHISPRRMVAAQLACVRADSRATLLNATAQACTRQGDGQIWVLLDTGETLCAPTVIVATGAFTEPALLSGYRLPLNVHGRTVLLRDVTDLTAEAGPRAAALASLPSLILDLGPHEPGLCDDVYQLPPIEYEDGRRYVKVGRRSTRFGQDKYSSAHGCQSHTRITHLSICLVWVTIHRIGDEEDPNVAVGPRGLHAGLFAAVGGNGGAAKSGDEIGRLAALMLLDRWDDRYPREPFLLAANVTPID